MFLTTEAMDEYAATCDDEGNGAPDALEVPSEDMVVFVTLIDHGDLVVELDTLF